MLNNIICNLPLWFYNYPLKKQQIKGKRREELPGYFQKPTTLTILLMNSALKLDTAKHIENVKLIGQGNACVPLVCFALQH